jgi:hypothetical protein
VQATGQQPDRIHRDDRHVPGNVGFPPLLRFTVASLGIALVSFAAAALNCLVERTIDAKMARTSWRGHSPRRHLAGSKPSPWPPPSAPSACGCSTTSSTT